MIRYSHSKFLTFNLYKKVFDHYIRELQYLYFHCIINISVLQSSYNKFMNYPSLRITCPLYKKRYSKDTDKMNQISKINVKNFKILS